MAVRSPAARGNAARCWPLWKGRPERARRRSWGARGTLPRPPLSGPGGGWPYGQRSPPGPGCGACHRTPATEGSGFIPEAGTEREKGNPSGSERRGLRRAGGAGPGPGPGPRRRPGGKRRLAPPGPCPGGTHRAEREPLLRATGENSTGEPAAATTARFFLPPGRERGLGAALPRFLRADPPGVRGEAGAEGNMAGERERYRPWAPAGRRLTASLRGGAGRSPCRGAAETPQPPGRLPAFPWFNPAAGSVRFLPQVQQRSRRAAEEGFLLSGAGEPKETASGPLARRDLRRMAALPCPPARPRSLSGRSPHSEA